MRAQSIRRSIHLANLFLGALVVLAGVHAVTTAAEAGTRQGGIDPEIRRILDDHRKTLGGAFRLEPSVDRPLIELTFEIKKNKTRSPKHWKFNGPVWVEVVPEPEVIDGGVAGLEALGRLITVMYSSDSSQVVFAATAGERRVLSMGESIRVHKGRSLVFVSVVKDGAYDFLVSWRIVGGDKIEVARYRAVEPDDGKGPIRPPRVRGEAEASAAEATAPAGATETGASARTLTQAEIAAGIEGSSSTGSRRRFVVRSEVFEAIRGPAGRALLEGVKTREVGGGIKLTYIPQKAVVVHKLKLANGDTLISINGISTPTRGTAAKVLRDLPSDTRRVTAVVDRNGRRITLELAVDPERIPRR